MIDALSRLRFPSVALLVAALLAPGLAAQDIPEMSPEAAAAFAEGMASYTNRDYAEAAEAFGRAYSLDSSFAVAAFFEGVNWGNAGEQEKARAAYARAQEGRHRMSAYYQHRLDAQTAGSTLDYLIENRKAARVAPTSKAAYNVGQGAQRLRRSREAVRSLETLDPDAAPMKGWTGYWTVLHAAQHNLGMYEAELESVGKARERYPDLPAIFYDEGEALIALGRVGEIDALIRDFETLDAPLAPFLSTLAAEADVHGQPETRDRLLDRAIDVFDALSAEDAATTGARNWRAFTHYSRGELGEAEAIYRELQGESPDNAAWRGWLGVVAAERGDGDAADAAIAELLDRRASGDPASNAMWAASIAAAMGDGDRFGDYIRLALDRGLEFNIWDHRSPAFRKVRSHPAYVSFTSPAG